VLKFITHPEKNAGKQKMKEMSGTVEIGRCQEGKNWQTDQTDYSVYFGFDTTKHPDMVAHNGHWPISFSYSPPDEATYQAIKQYENKKVEAKWTLDRAMTMDKLKSQSSVPVSKFTITGVVG
jgi:hypothetical protein